jgi:hypothetical protein
MMESEQEYFVQQIGIAMSDLSEDCHCAGWVRNTEHLIPELCRRAVELDRTQRWGHGEVTPERARELIALADRAASWADLCEPGKGFKPFHPFPIPARYVEEIEREQESPP